MMPQDRTAPAEQWRAVENGPDDWDVFDASGNIVACELTKTQAKLIAAAEAKAALCEELADALEYARRWLNKEDHDLGFVDAALNKYYQAGRAPQ